MRIHCPCHGNGSPIVGKAIRGLILNWVTRVFLAHSRLKATTLDHEPVDDAMKDRSVVKTVFDILLKIRRGFGVRQSQIALK